VKPLLVSHNLEGGAGGATLRLHQGLRSIGVPSQVLVQVRGEHSDDGIVTTRKRWTHAAGRLRTRVDNLPRGAYRSRQGYFYPQWILDSIPRRAAGLEPDVINLHWVLAGFVRIETLRKLQQPLVWTLHDMWAFTGGCDYSQTCTRYEESCGRCLVLNSDRERDLSRWVWKRKDRAWRELDFTVVTPSTWLANCARASSLFRERRIEVIPYGIDLQTFKPLDRQAARHALNLPRDKQLVLFGAWADIPRKGFDLLKAALQRLSAAGWADRLELAVFGVKPPRDEDGRPFRWHRLGRFRDALSLALVYSAADVMVIPSVQEALGFVGMESLACGTPIVVFDGTGAQDLVDHRRNGYVAKALDVDDLARGIAWILDDAARYEELARRARERAERDYALELCAHRYRDLFDEVTLNIGSHRSLAGPV
jgi:glycosyltransferase involved in cell wall biosynthesis